MYVSEGTFFSFFIYTGDMLFWDGDQPAGAGLGETVLFVYGHHHHASLLKIINKTGSLFRGDSIKLKV
jgi:hypothetical protein